MRSREPLLRFCLLPCDLVLKQNLSDLLVTLLFLRVCWRHVMWLPDLALSSFHATGAPFITLYVL